MQGRDGRGLSHSLADHLSLGKSGKGMVYSLEVGEVGSFTRFDSRGRQGMALVWESDRGRQSFFLNSLGREI